MRAALAILLMAMLAACTQQAPAPKITPPKTAKAMMVGVALRVQQCWFKKAEPALKPYRMAAEINSLSGQPRILIVPRNNPEGLPKLVAQAKDKGASIEFTRFGPLLETADGPRLAAQLDKWAQGQATC
ncbi:MAG: hypothetical protein AAF903_06120 [Pseudomonadota bacterium]